MSLRDTLERIRSDPVPNNEEEAKFRILAPILAELGWDPFGTEVRWEYPAGGRKGGGKVDIALVADGRVSALIEAKAPGANLDDHVEQVMGYAFHEGVAISALTDGLVWWLYFPLESGPPQERRFAVLDVGNGPVDQISDDLNTFLSRESLMTGRAETRAKQVLSAQREAAKLAKEMPRIWRRMLDAPDGDLVDLIGQRVYEELSLRPDRDQVVAAMRNRPIPPPRSSAPAPPPAEPQAPAPSPSSPTAIMLWGTRHSIKLPSDILMIVVEELYKRHADSFDQTVEPLKYQEWQWVSRDRERVGSKNPKQTPSGYFVNVHMTAKRQRQRWNRLLEAFGYSESDLQLLYEETPSKKPSSRRQTRRPVAVRLWGERHPVRTHVEILMTVVEELHRRHPNDFDHAAETLGAGEWQYVSRNRQQVRGPHIKQTAAGHFVNVNLSAREIRTRAVQFMEALGHRESDLEYLYK